MRQLSLRQHGMTLIEIMVGLVITTLRLGVAAPYLGDFVANSRLREGGNALMAEALYAQSEALKRNGQVRLVIATGQTQVIDMGVVPNVTLRTRSFGQGISADELNIDFGSDGMTRPRGTQGQVDIAYAGVTCSAEHRCPRLRFDAGGSVRLCGNKLDCP